jgi:glycosyltransferase involved in cell wall biosynthesis
MAISNKIIIWKTASSDIAVASIRIRCLLPAFALEEYGYSSILLSGDESMTSFDNVIAIVFIKTFSEYDYDLAHKASSNNIPIYLDLCDNIFITHYQDSKEFSRIIEIAELSSAIVTTGPELARQIKNQIKSNTRISIIPDMIDKKYNLSEFIRRVDTMKQLNSSLIYNTLILKKKSVPLHSLRKLIPFLAQCKYGLFESFQARQIKIDFFRFKKSPSIEFYSSKAKTVIWFGKGGGSFSSFGIPSLLEIAEFLIRVNEIIPIKLLIVSNNYHSYKTLIAPLPILNAYKSWDYEQIYDDISDADVCIIPNCKDDFSLSKSPNRAILALSLGVPVVATGIPSLKELNNCLVLDDWENGLINYLKNPARGISDVTKAKLILDEKYGSNTIAGLWDDLFQFRNSSSKCLP